MDNEFLHMQKLAGLITESEYQAKITPPTKERKYDEDITKKNYKYGFYKLVYPNTPQYEIGDEVRVKDGRKIKIVTITDKKEIPYKNFGGNAFRPHSFQYEFK